jgi:hypothetical protein
MAHKQYHLQEFFSLHSILHTECPTKYQSTGGNKLTYFEGKCYINMDKSPTFMSKDTVLSDKAHHSSLRPFHMKAGSAAIITISNCDELTSPRFISTWCS